MLCCHSNETRAPIANPLNSAQLEGTLYHSFNLRTSAVRAVVWECGEGQVTNIHFGPALCLTRNVVMIDGDEQVK